ncbi:NAD(P)/FAD-dependent oxidoreductase [Rhodohalobacter sp. 614A]|uniref:NAD(P)/FAD-dependent oxidoreductase n=1 Tax=Rhodohalobacter sp. 614A TaxID=2908649 RepID=UPI001F3AA7E9|nr:FAD-dependent oxidoreductase [Rhodohalobacter sp. 614A]
MPEFSFWEREEWLKSPDLFIVGAGIVGASTALFYKERFPDHDVVVTDRGFAPYGASTRNAGFACIGSISEHLADIKKAGEETVLNRIERRWKGLQLLRKTVGDENMDYHHTGGFEIFTDEEKFDRSREKIAWMNQILKDRIGVEGVYSSTTFQGYPAIKNRVEGAINSGKLMRYLHEKLMKAGVRVWWNCPVSRVKSNQVILTDSVEVNPKKVVLAVNGFVSKLAEIPVKPARGYVFITKPIPDFKWKAIFHHNEGYVYFRNVGDRLLLGGGRDQAIEEETSDEFRINPKIKNYLIDFAENVLKVPSGWEIDMEWSGIMGMTENKEPIIKEVEKDVWAAAGLSGMGIAIGMQVAKDVVSELSH